MKKKMLIITLAVILTLSAALTASWLTWREKPTQGSKTVTIEVIDKEGNSTVYNLKTDAQYLREAMEEAEGLEFSGTESEYGMMVDTVNGETADYGADSSYWGFFVNGEYCNYGIDTQPVEDGDAFQIIYTIG